LRSNSLQFLKTFLKILIHKLYFCSRFRTAQLNGELKRVDFFEACKLLAQNPTGREIIWDYFRINYEAIFERYGEEDPRVGQLLIDIVTSFENEFLFYEVNSND
jgi:hypothetical protein